MLLMVRIHNLKTNFFSHDYHIFKFFFYCQTSTKLGSGIIASIQKFQTRQKKMYLVFASKLYFSISLSHKYFLVKILTSKVKSFILLIRPEK
jgi:hypothetical protein